MPATARRPASSRGPGSARALRPCGAPWREQERERLHRRLGRTSCAGEEIDELHQPADRRVEPQPSKSSVTAATVRATTLACSSVISTAWTRGSSRTSSASASTIIRQARRQESVNPLDPLHAPGLDRFERTHEHLIKPQAVGAVFGDDRVGIDHVAAALDILWAGHRRGRRVGREDEAFALSW